MKSSNILIVVAVLALVGGVAWFRSVRERSGNVSATPAGATNAAPAHAEPGPQRSDAPHATRPPAPATGAVPPSAAGRDSAPGAGAAAGDGSAAAWGGVSGTGSAAARATPPAASQKLPRVVDLGADKCKACKELAPIIAELRREYEGRVIIEFIDVWKDPRAGEPYKFRVIPTQVFFDADGREVWRHEGFLPKAEFVAKFAELGVR